MQPINCKTIHDLTKFRIWAPNLKMGRHKGTPSDQGFCKLCKDDIVFEDKVHFLLQCPSLRFGRFFADILSKLTDFKSSNNLSKLIWLISNGDFNNIL